LVVRTESRSRAADEDSSSSESEEETADSDYDENEDVRDPEREEVACDTENNGVALRAQFLRPGKPVQSIESDTHPLQLQPHRRQIAVVIHTLPETSASRGTAYIAPIWSLTDICSGSEIGIM